MKTLVECKADDVLVRCIGNLPKREVVHELKGKYEVCRRLGTLSNCRGVIDEDPLSVQPSYCERITREGGQTELAEHNIKLLYDKSLNNRIVVLCPRLEGWILRVAIEADVDVEKHGLPNDEAELHRIINERLDRFERMLDELMSRGSSSLKALRNLLQRKA